MGTSWNELILYVVETKGIVGMYLSRNGKEIFDIDLKEIIVYPVGNIGNKIQENSTKIIYFDGEDVRIKVN